MDAWMWALIVVAIIAIAAVVWLALMKRRTTTLRDQFGSEYDRTLQQTESRREAEADLTARREHREQLDIRPLSPAAQERYSSQWQQVQSRFVDQPAESLGQADELVLLVMAERGYPTDDFEQRAADISVDHPDVVERYRAGQAVTRSAATNDATTEDLRQGLVHYRALFEQLLVTGGTTEARREVG